MIWLSSEPSLSFFSFYPIKLDEDIRDSKPDGLFDFYNVSPYIMNQQRGNNRKLNKDIPDLCRIPLLSACMTNNNNAIVDLIFHILRGILIWKFFISYVLSNYQSNMLHLGCGIKWYSFETEYGILNFGVACLFGLLI